jgi:hypothetical protein
MPRKSEPRAEIAFVAEDSEPDHIGWLAGTFSVHSEKGDGTPDNKWEQVDDGLSSVSIEEAIAWGRAHAPRVLVQLGSGPAGAIDQVLYSAGEEPIDDKRAIPWPAEGIEIRARPVGTAADGRDQVKVWSVEIDLEVDDPTGDDVEDARRLVEADPVPEAVRIDRAEHSLTARFEVRDRPGMANINEVMHPVLGGLARRFDGRISGIRVH